MKSKFIRYRSICLLVSAVLFGRQEAFSQEGHWVGTWGCAVQLTEPKNDPPPPGLADDTLRQIVHVSIGGKRLRVRFSNVFGTSAVTMNSVHVALCPGARPTAVVDPATDKAVTFRGAPSAVIAPGEEMLSDPFDFDLPPLANLAITIYFGRTSDAITGHPGSRTASYILAGDAVASPGMSGAVKVEHWYTLSGVETMAPSSSWALVALGDSITDGRGSTTDANDRWPDDLAARLHADARTAGVGVINAGIGGNGIFGGLGPAATRRFDRDVLDRGGARWAIIFEGINDIGSRRSTAAIADGLIAAYRQFVAKAHARNIRVYGATLTPFGGSGYYSELHEAARQKVNAWIRTSRLYDGVIDFDAAVRDPARPANLRPAYDCGDHLHPSPAGYRAMAEAIDLSLFTP